MPFPNPCCGQVLFAVAVPTVADRFIQQAIAQVLTPIYEEQFHGHSYGFRPNRCAQQAILTDKYNRVIGKRAPSKKGGYTP